MPGSEVSGAKNVKHVFTLYCEEQRYDVQYSCQWSGGMTTHVYHMELSDGLFLYPVA